MLKKSFLIVIILLVVAVAWLGGIFSVSLSPFSLTIRKPEKDILKTAARKVKGWVYHEATVHNPPGDVLPDQVDDDVLNKIKEKIN